MKCREIIKVLEELSPTYMACDWDNPGLLAGRSDKGVKKIFLALDATEQVIEEAVEIGADLLVTHHPLIFKSVKKINDEDFIGRRLLTLIQNDISYYAMHTNFDSAPGCMGKLAADRIGLKEQRVLEPMGVSESLNQEDGLIGKEYGIGMYGILEKAIPLHELARRVKEAYQIPFVKVFGADCQEIKKIAICPGAGGSTFKAALHCQAEAYISGDIGHHDGIDAVASGMAVIDAGHYGIEHIFMDFMKQYLTEHLPEEILIIKAAEVFPNYIV